MTYWHPTGSGPTPYHGLNATSEASAAAGLVAGKGFLFSDRGETEMRGLEDSVRRFEVRWQEDD